MTDPTLDDEAYDVEPAAGIKISVVSFAGRIENARAMADNILKTPANEQNITHVQTFAAQAIRDLADAVEDLAAQIPVRSAPAADSEKSYECIVCGTAIESETVDLNLERCYPCAAAGKTDENGYPDAKTIAENERERQGATDQIDRCMEEIVDWCKRVMPHFQKSPEFKIAKAFDDELREICRRHVSGKEPTDV